jgi:hypothetical protein
MLWVDTKTDSEVEALHASIWNPVFATEEDGSITGRCPGPVEEGGDFWYDTLQREKADPVRRYEIARRHLPLPAAWREMAIALRAMISLARKSDESYENYLKELHQLASIWSFSDPAPSGRAGTGYRIMELTPYAKFAAFDLQWNRIGCDKLALLNQSDRKLMRYAWGEPDNHSTASQLYREFVAKELRRIDRAESRLRKESLDRSMAQFDQLDRARQQQGQGLFAAIWRRLIG